jgi:hypothetical protein
MPTQLPAKTTMQTMSTDGQCQTDSDDAISCFSDGPKITVLSFDVGIRNLAYCLCRFQDDGKLCEILEWDVVDVVENAGSRAKTRNLGMQRTVDMILQFLCENSESWAQIGIDRVYVEQQLARAATMKVVQFAIYGFAKIVFPDAAVRLCHAKKKLSVDLTGYGCTQEFVPPERKRARRSDEDLSKTQLAKRRKQDQYKHNKDRCTWYARMILQNLDDAQATSRFEASKKKDDLADSMMQAVAAVNG